MGILDNLLGGARGSGAASAITDLIGSHQGTIGDLAKKLGLDPHAAAGQICEFLPQILDQLTRNGAVEGGAPGGIGGLLGKLKL